MLLSTMIIKLTVESHQPLAVVADGCLLPSCLLSCFLPKADIRKHYKIKAACRWAFSRYAPSAVAASCHQHNDTVRRYAPHYLLNDLPLGLTVD